MKTWILLFWSLCISFALILAVVAAVPQTNKEGQATDSTSWKNDHNVVLVPTSVEKEQPDENNDHIESSAGSQQQQQQQQQQNQMDHESAPDIPGIFFNSPHDDRIVKISPEQQVYDDLHHNAPQDPSSSEPTKLAIVSTVYEVNDMLRDWLQYYLEEVKLDFTIVFIDHPVKKSDSDSSSCVITSDGEEFCDTTDAKTPSTTTEESLRERWGSKLIFVRRGPALDAELETLGTLYDKFGGFYSFEVQARQLLHYGLVADRSHALGVDWALQLDLDELWMLPKHETARSHFDQLNRDNITQAKYPNLEVVPMKEDIGEGESPFQQTRFLRSENCMVDQPNQLGMAGAVRNKRKTATGLSIYLQGYWTGKMAGRVSTRTIHPHDVCVNVLPLSVWDATKIAVFDDSGGPVILHYISTGPEAWRAKHKQKGSISDRSFDHSLVDISFIRSRPGAQNHFPASTTQIAFARASRDQVEKQDASDVLEWYRTNICFSPMEERSLQQAGVMVEVTDIASIMADWSTTNGILQPSSATVKSFRPETSATATTCPEFPQFQCYVRSVDCCRLISSRGFTFLKHQLGHKGKRMEDRKEWLKTKKK